MSISQMHFTVDVGPGRKTLEEYLFDRFPDLSRMYIRGVIRNEKCAVNGRVENKGKRVRTGDFVEIDLDLDRETAMRAEFLPLEVVFEDLDLIVVNKTAGMLVHPTHSQKNGTLLNALSFHFNRNAGTGPVRPGLVHRLDKDTSGLIVAAKNLKSHRDLARQFHRKTVEKVYLALVEGVPENDSGTIESSIGRFPDEKRWGVKSGARPSITRFDVIEKHANASLLKLEPVTGRTNQLRIHCASIGHPIVGDVSRGGRVFARLCLHALLLSFSHPRSGERLVFATESPVEFAGNARLSGPKMF